MEKKFSSEVPVQVERNGSIRVLNYGVREATEAEMAEAWKSASMSEQGDVPTDDFVRSHKYVYYSVRVPMAQWNYGGIINAIVRDRYTVDEMESITNNVTAVVSEFFNGLVAVGLSEAIKILMSSFKGSNTELFMEMQMWRAMAKREAKAALQME